MKHNKTLFLFIIILITCGTGMVLAGPPMREIVVNVPGFSLYVYENGVVIREYPISIGSELKPSQLGETTIINKVIDPTYYPSRWWERGLAPIPPGPNNPVGTSWLGLGFPSYGIHGTNDPSSIGKAASSGCIRMNNSDVEELTLLVDKGTPVKLMYQTVVLDEDPLFLNKTIIVHEDIYNRGTTHSQLQEELERRGWHDVFWPAMREIVEGCSGEPEPLPTTMPVFMNDEELPVFGVKYGSQFFIPYESLGDHDGASENSAIKYWGGETYLEVDQYAQKTGFAYKVSEEAIGLYAPQAYLGDVLLGHVLIADDTIYIPVDNLADIMPAETGSLVPRQVTVVRFQGDYYVPSWMMTQFGVEEELRIEEPNLEVQESEQ